MKVLKVGIAPREAYKKRTMSIAKGEYVPSQGEPKVWFESLSTLAQVLSDQNRALLKRILETHLNLSTNWRNDREGRPQIFPGHSAQWSDTDSCS